jgi:rubrerythrin
MGGLYAAEEAIRFAVEAERCGLAFYEELAKCSKTDSVRVLCEDLGRQEQAHADQFTKLLDQAKEQGYIRPATWDELSFARSLIEERLLPDEDAAREMASTAESDTQAIDIAIQFEKNSVLFYTEMLTMTDTLGEPLVQAILDAEKRHARLLIELKRMLAEQ